MSESRFPIPPPELKVFVDKTAGFVAKNGPAFEENIKKKQRNNPKFGFLSVTDPYHEYYLSKILESRENLLGSIHEKAKEEHNQYQEERYAERVSPPEHKTEQQEDHRDHNDDSRDGKEEDHEEDTEPVQIKPRSRLLEQYIEEKTMKLEEPPDLNFLAKPSPNMTIMESDIIKLTARYIATYGRSFLLDLISKEHSNPLFDFTKPQHGQFKYMTNLIIQYSLIINHPLGIVEELDKDINSHKYVLDKFKMRTEWMKLIESEKKEREEVLEREKLLYSQIDWHDFIVVETIDYQPDEKGEYPPTTKDQVGSRMLMQQRIESTKIQPEEMDIDDDVDMLMDSDQEDELEVGSKEIEEGMICEERQVNNSDDDNFAVPDIPKDIVIRKGYDPKAAAASRLSTQTDGYFVSPITNERVPISKIDEHVKFNLADPKYLQKKNQMMQDKLNEEAVFASGSQVQNSLNSFAERRTDIFGMNHQETIIGRRIGEEEDQAEQKEDKIIWDGHKSSLKKKKIG